MKIPEFILKRPVSVVMLWTGLILGGIWAIFNIRTDFLPDFTVPKLTVISSYRGLPADEIRRLITIPLEDSLSSLSGLKRMKSISRDGFSLIELEFPWGIDRTEAGLETRGIIDLAWLNLPSDASKPRVLAIDPGDLPIITLAVFPKNGSLSLARRISEKELRSRLQRIDGVGSIEVSGGTIEEVHVDADPVRLAGSGYNLQELARAIKESNLDYPAGTITEGNTEYLVRTRSKAENMTELGEIFLPKRLDAASVSAVRLKDLATIQTGEKEQSSIFFSTAIQPESDKDSANPSAVREGVRLQIRRTPGFSPAGMAENIRSELDDIRRSYNRDLEIIVISDRSLPLRQSLQALVLSLLSGSVFSFAVILLFMRNLPRALLLLVSLPSSLLLSVLLLFLTGKSLNLMSLGGLAIGVGMVVDNSIVVTECLSRLKLSSETVEFRVIIIAQALTEAAAPLTGSTLTTIIVFLPLLFIRGLIGALFADLGLSVIFALSSSLLISLSLIPVLYLLMNPGNIQQKHSTVFFRQIIKAVKAGLRHPVITAVTVLFCCLAALIPAGSLRVEVITPVSEGFFRTRLNLPPGTGIETVKLLTAEIINSISAIPGVSRVDAWAGGESQNPYYIASTEESSNIIQLEIKHLKNSSPDLIKEHLASATGPEAVTIEFAGPENILENLIGISENTDWVIRGEDPEKVRQAASEVISNISEARLIPEVRKTNMIIFPDRNTLYSFGINLSDLSGYLRQAVYGEIPTSILINGEDTDVRVRITEAARSGRDDILRLNMPGKNSSPVRMSSILSIREEYVLPYLSREDRKDIAVIRVPSGAGKNIASMLESRGAERRDISVLAAQLPRIIQTFILAAALLYLCLGLQFESFSLPLLLMLNIPTGVSGIALMLFLTGHSINLNSSMGILVVMGISVNNGILLFQEASRMMKRGGTLPSGALYRGTVSRLSPILMTSLTTITALIPLTVDPFGASSQASLSVSIIGGLISSTIVSLLILPNLIRNRLKISKR